MSGAESGGGECNMGPKKNPKSAQKCKNTGKCRGNGNALRNLRNENFSAAFVKMYPRGKFSHSFNKNFTSAANFCFTIAPPVLFSFHTLEVRLAGEQPPGGHATLFVMQHGWCMLCSRLF